MFQSISFFALLLVTVLGWAVAAEHYAGDKYSGSVSPDTYDFSWVPHHCTLAHITIEANDFAKKATWNGTYWTRTRFVNIFGGEPTGKHRTTVSGNLGVAFSSDDKDYKTLVSVTFEGLMPPTAKEECLPLPIEDGSELSTGTPDSD